MKCPQCGRFMSLEHTESPREPAYEWWCSNFEVCTASYRGIAAPEYDWLTHLIDDDEMARLQSEDPETWAEFDAMRLTYENRYEIRRRRDCGKVSQASNRNRG
jgi:hypothetical protein